ncbi:hypothetical protein KA005_01205, partial [bacterium]|nr:hypothetical protein [bacterium]
MANMNKRNMYSHSVKQWCPFIGCKHNCKYCSSSFQTQIKRWAKANCQQYYDFVPHKHDLRLKQNLPNTKYMQFIFTCSSGDIAFCDTPYFERIV